MTDTTTAAHVARHSVGDVHGFCTPRLDGSTMTLTFEDGRTENHDVSAFTVKASIGSYEFESSATSFTLAFVDKSTGAAMSTLATAGALAALGSATAGLSVGNSAARHAHATNALAASGYNDFYDPLKATAGDFKESWRFRPSMLFRYAMLWLTLPFFLFGSVALLFATPMVGALLPAIMISSVLRDQALLSTLLASGMAFVVVTTSAIWVPIARVAPMGVLGMMAQNYWATPPQQAAHLDATTGQSAGDRHRLRNLIFYNEPRWISVAMPYAALACGLVTLLTQKNDPSLDVSNDGPALATAIAVAIIAVQLVFAVKILIKSRTLQCDEAAWIEANITAENSLMTRANLIPLLRHGAFAGLLLVGAAALFSLA